MAGGHEILLTPVISTVVSDNKKLIASLEALSGKYDIKLNIDIDTSKVDKVLSDLQSKIDKATKSDTVSFADFKGAEVTLKRISAVTAEKLKQTLANQQLLADEKQRAAVEEASSKVSIAQSRASIQAGKEEIQNSKTKIQLENERIKLLKVAQQEAKISPTEARNKLSSKMENTLLGGLSASDTATLEKLRDNLMSRYYFSVKYIFRTFITNLRPQEFRRVVKAAFVYIKFRLRKIRRHRV